MAKKESKLLPFLLPILVFLIGVLLCIPAVYPILKHGLFSVHDDTQVVRIYEMYKSLKGGMFPVRWVEDLGYGFGYPIFNFYAPLAYYLGGGSMLLGLNLISATQFMFVFGALLAFVTMFFCVRSLLGTASALAAGLLYMYFPYHAVNIYVRGAVGEFYAYAFLPLVFWGMFKLFENFEKERSTMVSESRWILVSSFGIGLVAVSHNLTLFMLGLILVVYFGITIAVSKNRKQLALSYLFSLALGGMLAAFYVIPAALEAHYTNVTSQIGGGADFRNHFVCLKQLYESPWGFGGSVKGCTDGLSFKLGKINILFLIASVVLFIVSKIRKQKSDKEKIQLIVYVLFGVSLFFMLSISQFLWQITPQMEFLQYPWRFLNFAGLFFVFIVSFFLHQLKPYYRFAPIMGSAVIIGLTLYFNIKLFAPSSFTDKTVLEYIYPPDIRYRVSKISDEYMPKGFSKPKNEDEISTKSIEIIGSGTISHFKKTQKDITATVAITKPSQVRFLLAYFPTWKFYVNGAEITPQVTHNGVQIPLNPGNYTVAAQYHQTLIERISDSISLVGIFILVIVIIRSVFIRNYGKKTS